MCSITERRAALASLQVCWVMLTMLTACCSLLMLHSLDTALPSDLQPESARFYAPTFHAV